MKRIFVYDLEVVHVFTATFLDANSDYLRTFVLSGDRDDITDLLKFLKEEVSGLIGYNCLNYDSQILEYILRNNKPTASELRGYSDSIIGLEKPKMDVPEWKLSIPHLDLYRIHHFDNRNRMVSLKWCEFMMDLDNIEDMPDHGSLEEILSYNLNDVIATKELYKRTIPMIKLRMELSKMYGLNLENASNSKIGSELLLSLYCKKTGRRKSDVREMRTYRPHIKLGNIIFPYIHFKSTEFNLLLSTLKKKEISSTKGAMEYSIKYKGFQFDYGLGGIHGSVSNQIVESNDEYMIIDADVSSLYPNIAVVNRMYPRHLGPEFYQVYKNDIVDVRMTEKAKKDKGNKSIVEGFKEAANATYGKSNDIYSWLYDPQYTMETTINGQLELTMLAESLLELPKSEIIQINTDGLTLRLPRNQIEKYYDLCKRWENITQFQLEYAEYKKMIIFDVNNYIAVYTNGKHKCKGRCEFENIPLHKNKSHNIIPIAFFEHFVNGKPIEETIRNHKDIFDFCAGIRARSSEKRGRAHFELHWLKDNSIISQKLSKTVRYFISTTGQYLYKVYEDGTKEHVEAPTRRKDWKVTYFNNKFDVDFSTINYAYYLSKTRELIEMFENRTLFD